MKRIIFTMLLMISENCFSQGFNHIWLLGNQNLITGPKARMFIDSTSYTINTELRKMAFKGTEATICDKQGDFLMSSNGVWIANANNDTMMNGGGLNPGTNVFSNPNGLLNTYSNIFLPYPGDSTKYILFHHTDEWDGYSYPTFEILYSMIDITLDSGRGGVVTKNNIAFSDTLNWGFGACKHANGRDWWVVISKQNSDLLFIILLTPDGIVNINSQKLNVPVAYYNVTHLTFSQDGSKFAYDVYDSLSLASSVLVFNFDRCTGIFSNPQIIPVTTNSYLWGLEFSPSAKFIYACTSINIYQISIDSLTIENVAAYDGFYSPNTFCCPTTFFHTYLAANGKIYVTTGSGTYHMHEINYPDSTGLACDVQQHAINLGVYHLRAVPNHPNYYLGPVVGSVCDSLTGINEHLDEIQNISIRPNPNNGNFSISYLLPQTATGGKSGWFEIYDVMGKQIYKIPLPPWSTMQSIQLPPIPTGIYNAVINSGYNRVSKKIAVIKE